MVDWFEQYPVALYSMVGAFPVLSMYALYDFMMDREKLIEDGYDSEATGYTTDGSRFSRLSGSRERDSILKNSASLELTFLEFSLDPVDRAKKTC